MSSIYKRILKDGSVRYEAHTIVQEPGGRRRATNKRFKRRKDAQDWLDHLNVDVSDGTYRELTKATFGEYAEHWKKTQPIIANYKPSTLTDYLAILENHLLPAFRYQQIAAISSKEIDRLQADMRQQAKSSGTISNTLSFLSKMMKHAIKDGYIRHSPLEGVEKPKRSNEESGKAIPKEEILLLEKHANETIRLPFLAAVLTGMRRGELFGLGWEHIIFDEDIIQVRRSLYQHRGKWREEREASGGSPFEFVIPKTPKSRRDLDLSPRLKKELRALWMQRGQPKQGLIFHRKDGRPYDMDNMTGQFYRLQEKAGLGTYREIKEQDEDGKEIVKRIYRRAYRWHDLRHTFGSAKIEQGEDIVYVSRQMGHSNVTTTLNIYAHLFKARRPEAAAKTDAVFFGN